MRVRKVHTRVCWLQFFIVACLLYLLCAGATQAAAACQPPQRHDMPPVHVCCWQGKLQFPDALQSTHALCAQVACLGCLAARVVLCSLLSLLLCRLV